MLVKAVNTDSNALVVLKVRRRPLPYTSEVPRLRGIAPYENEQLRRTSCEVAACFVSSTQLELLPAAECHEPDCSLLDSSSLCSTLFSTMNSMLDVDSGSRTKADICKQ